MITLESLPMELPVLFGIRHLSPAGAWHLLRLLDEKRPRLVLIEGPSAALWIYPPRCS